jgi:hypothetical protein
MLSGQSLVMVSMTSLPWVGSRRERVGWSIPIILLKDSNSPKVSKRQFIPGYIQLLVRAQGMRKLTVQEPDGGEVSSRLTLC